MNAWSACRDKKCTWKVDSTVLHVIVKWIENVDELVLITSFGKQSYRVHTTNIHKILVSVSFLRMLYLVHGWFRKDGTGFNRDVAFFSRKYTDFENYSTLWNIWTYQLLCKKNYTPCLNLYTSCILFIYQCGDKVKLDWRFELRLETAAQASVNNYCYIFSSNVWPTWRRPPEL